MQPSERDSAAVTSPSTDTARKPASVAHGGRAVHPVVAAVLAVTPAKANGELVIEYIESEHYLHGVLPIWGSGEPIAARQAAEVLRWLVEWIREQDREGQCRCYGCINDLADELAPKETNP